MKSLSCCILVSLMAVNLYANLEGGDVLSFATVKSTEAATDKLHKLGLEPFMDVVWRQGVTAPGIHSKFWLDQFARGKPKLYEIEKAYRDFGRELAEQVENLALTIYKTPDRSQEQKRFDWLMRFSKWMMKPGRFENYRIGMRVEDAAIIPLFRMSFDLDIPIENVQASFERLLPGKENAVLRANILFEESGGAFDVRRIAKKTESDADSEFEERWVSDLRRAYRHFGDRLLDYTLDAEILLEEDVKYSFFMDDRNDLGGRYCISERWDLKTHHNVCVIGDRSYMTRVISSILTFRRDVGCFPEVKIAAGKDGYDVYGDYYFNEYSWRKQRTSAPAWLVGKLYWQYKTNAYMDNQTRYSLKTMNKKQIPRDEYECLTGTKERRAQNRLWLKKNRKDPRH